MLRRVAMQSATVLPFPGALREEGEAGLLDGLGPLGGAHVLVLGGRGAGLMGGLLARGCLAATLLRRAERPEAGAYEIVLVPQVVEGDCLDTVVCRARRALVPGGALVASMAPGVGGVLAHRLAQRLRLGGFTAVRLVAMDDGAVLVRARMPALRRVAVPAWGS